MAEADPARRAADAERARAKEVAQLRGRLERLEAEIDALGTKLEEITAGLDVASAAADTAKIAELGQQHEFVTATLSQREEEWLTLREALDATAAESESAAKLDATAAGSYRSA